MDFIYKIDSSLSVNVCTIKYIEIITISDKTKHVGDRKHRIGVYFKDGTFKCSAELHSDSFVDNLLDNIHSCTKEINFK